MMTPQMIFDKALTKVLKQGVPALNGGGGCDYYTQNGNMCAVGLLLGKKLAVEWTLAGIGEVAECEAFSDKVGIPDWVKRNIDLLMGIQGAHDIFLHGEAKLDLEHWRSEFIRKMKLVAQGHGLAFPESLLEHEPE